MAPILSLLNNTLKSEMKLKCIKYLAKYTDDQMICFSIMVNVVNYLEMVLDTEPFVEHWGGYT